MPELHQHNRYRQFKLPCRVGSQGSHTMNDSIELPALAMSIDEEVKAEASEAVDQTMVSMWTSSWTLLQLRFTSCLVTCLHDKKKSFNKCFLLPNALLLNKIHYPLSHFRTHHSHSYLIRSKILSIRVMIQTLPNYSSIISARFMSRSFSYRVWQGGCCLECKENQKKDIQCEISMANQDQSECLPDREQSYRYRMWVLLPKKKKPF